MLAFYENRKNDLTLREISHHRIACSAHLHHHIEVAVMLDGHAVAFADTEHETLESGDIFIAFPNQIHRYESHADEHYVLLIINPNLMPALAAVFDKKLPRKNVIKGAANDLETLRLLYRLVEINHTDDAFSATEKQGLLLMLFSRLLRLMELTADGGSGDTHPLKSIISYCMQNYQSEISLATLEKELHISRYYISHLFSDKLRIHFNDYINSLRISYACHYLRHSNRPVTEIAGMVGFTTSRTFNRAFAKQMQTTPSEYRRRETAQK